MSVRVASLASVFLITAACVSAQAPAANKSPTPAATSGVLRAEVVAKGLVNPWGIDFLPEGRMIVTEKPGRLRIVEKDGTLGEPVTGVPAVAAQGQGGLLDVAVDPKFAETKMIYLSFSEPGEDRMAGTAVARGRLVGNALTEVEVIYRQSPKVRSGGHYGSRIVFRGDGTLFITAGDRQNQRPLVQDLSTGIGKIVRINRDGSIPKDNPFVGKTGVNEAIWSYGHRNLQGATLDGAGRLWTVEHGAKGGDELNHPEAGKNYGWPIITYGTDYNGTKIGEGTEKAGMEQPVYFWDPVIAPSALIYYTGDKLPGWKGNFIAGGMGSVNGLVRLVMENGKVVREERHLTELGMRVRDVQQGPDGFVYITSDVDGQILRVRPVGR
jgi:glucose/arabinose dehydrogenase